MTQATKFPEAILETGFEEKEELFFFLKKFLGKTEQLILMKAKQGSVKEVSKKDSVEGLLPVYVQPMSRYIFTGKLETA